LKFFLFLETLAIDVIGWRNLPEELGKININRKARVSGFTQLTVIAQRMATERDTYVWERVIRS
jgi:hypothetical protein